MFSSDRGSDAKKAGRLLLPTNAFGWSPSTVALVNAMLQGACYVGKLLFICSIASAVLCICIASPPLHLLYKSANHAGSGSIYLSGGGFAGFWYSLGCLKSFDTLEDHNFYCFSSACMSMLMAAANIHFEDALETSLSIQRRYLDGEISRFDVVQQFSKDLVSGGMEFNEQFQAALPRLNILITTPNEGVVIKQASTLHELRDLLLKTTYIPFVTGGNLWLEDSRGNIFLDGGFSRMLHPPTEYTIAIPTTFETVLHAFNPGLSRQKARAFFAMGQESCRDQALLHEKQ